MTDWRKATVAVTSEVLNVKNAPYNAVGDDSANDYAAIVAAVAATGGAGEIVFPPGVYRVGTPAGAPAPLVMDSAAGLVMSGVGTTPGAPTIKYMPASGSLMTLDGALGLKLRDLCLVYANAGYNGDLVKTDGTSRDTRNLKIDDCWLGSLNGGPATAASILKLNKTITSRIRGGDIQGGVRGIVKGASYVTTLKIEDVNFNRLVTSAIKNPDTAWRILDNTFEASTTGTPAGIEHDLNFWSQALRIEGNYFGDLGADAAAPWITLRGSGIAIGANYLDCSNRQHGGLTNNYSLLLDRCFGVKVDANDMFGSSVRDIKVQAPTGFTDGFVALANYSDAPLYIDGEANIRRGAKVGSSDASANFIVGQPTGVSQYMQFGSPVAAGAAANNSVYVSSADGKLYYKDGAGNSFSLY